MIIGSDFSRKYQDLLKEIATLASAQKDSSHPIAVKKINASLNLDRTEIKNVLEYLEELGYIEIKTIGGPLLYGHITITELGLSKYQELTQH
ncbi:hypothetical protein [Fodinibius halophilus]|uniref:Transcriptional regulator n=1 Tax=Fodinibius halophilus TaxID=1736908 RepID=A0A6M1T4L2_9BACT|nr:hypothetical protein [Fodinibius halophilus]NGP86901.1 hypothetical protein [Fodinibius halophilus]